MNPSVFLVECHILNSWFEIKLKGQFESTHHEKCSFAFHWLILNSLNWQHLGLLLFFWSLSASRSTLHLFLVTLKVRHKSKKTLFVNQTIGLVFFLTTEFENSSAQICNVILMMIWLGTVITKYWIRKAIFDCIWSVFCNCSPQNTHKTVQILVCCLKTF